jgi:hypothetical protein
MGMIHFREKSSRNCPVTVGEDGDLTGAFAVVDSPEGTSLTPAVAARFISYAAWQPRQDAASGARDEIHGLLAERVQHFMTLWAWGANAP